MSYSDFLDSISVPNLGWVLLDIAAIADLVLPFVFGLFVKSFTHKYMVMSALASPSSPVRFLYSCWLVCAGCMFLFASLQAYYAYAAASSGLAMTLAVCLAIYGIGACILAGLFSVGKGNRPQTAGEWIHGIGASFGFMALILATLFLSLLQIQDGEASLGALSLICFVTSCVFFVLFVLSDKDRFAGTPVSWTGVWQRLTLLAAYLPLIATAAAHLRAI